MSDGAGFDYKSYVASHNAGDVDAFVDRWLTDDCVFHFGARKNTGRESIRAFLEGLKRDGIREVLRPQRVLSSAKLLFAEVDIDFHATRDEPKLSFATLKQGEFVTVKYFLLHTIRDGRVAHLEGAHWPAGEGVSAPKPVRARSSVQ
jgi:hypothetical protein